MLPPLPGASGGAISTQPTAHLMQKRMRVKAT